MCLLPQISSRWRVLRSVLRLVSGLATLGSPARAQPEVTWERVGDRPHDSRNLPLSVGPNGYLWGGFNELETIDGEQVFYDGLYRLPSPYDSATVWEHVSDSPRSLAASGVYWIGQDTLLLQEVNRTYRSVNSGQTWTEIPYLRATTRLIEIPAGVPYEGRLVAVRGGAMVSFSDDRGASWREAARGFGTGNPPILADSAEARRIAIVTTGPHAGRLVAGGLSGITVSDDGGYMWKATSEFAYFQQSTDCIATLHGQAPGGGDRLIAVTSDIRIPDDSVRVTVSDDGGDTWERVASLIRGSSRTCVEVVDLGDGRAAALMLRGPLWWTEDAGKTWARWAEWEDLVPPAEAQAVGAGKADWAIVGPDGRLYVGITEGGSASIYDKRSSEPVASWAVASEPEAETESTSLSVSPNPSRQLVTIALAGIASPSAEVVIVDAQGREVARKEMFASVSWRVDVRAWAPGVYHARVVGDHQLGVVAFTVVR